MAAVDLSKVVRSALNTLRYSLQEQGFALEHEVEDGVQVIGDADALNQFKNSETVFSAQVSAVAAAEGAAAKARYKLGLAVFTVTKGGLMFEASIGGQKFTFTPVAR